jgi:hypothetical protein
MEASCCARGSEKGAEKGVNRGADQGEDAAGGFYPIGRVRNKVNLVPASGTAEVTVLECAEHRRFRILFSSVADSVKKKIGKR